MPAKRKASSETSATAIGKTVDDAMVAIERDNPRLKGVLPKGYARPGLGPDIPEELRATIRQFRRVQIERRTNR